MERLLAWYQVGSSFGGRRRPGRRQPRPAGRRPVVRLGCLGDPHHLLAGERHLRRCSTSSRCGAQRGRRMARRPRWPRHGGGSTASRSTVGSPSGTDKAALIPFFIMHYGIFWVVHGLFVLTLPLVRSRTGADGAADFGTTLNPLAILFVLIGLFISHGGVVPLQLHRPRRIPANDCSPADVRAVRSPGRPPRHDHRRRRRDRE